MYRYGVPVDMERIPGVTLLCKCSDGVCVNCGRPMKRCDAKRHCRVAAVYRRVPQSRRKLPVGSALTAILAHFGIKKSAGCSCKSIEAAMDFGGAMWCLARVGVLSRSISASARKSGKYCPLVLAAALILVAILFASVKSQFRSAGVQ